MSVPISTRSGGRGRALSSFTALSVAAASLVFAAVNSEGFRTTSTDLHDGTVWTMSVERNSIVRVNARVKEFDTRIRTDVSNAQLYQEGTSVYVQTSEGFAQLNSVGTNLDDVTFNEVPPGSQIGVAGKTAAMLAPGGEVWVVPAQALLSLDGTQEPTSVASPGSQLSVTGDGKVLVIDPVEDTVTVISNEVATAETLETQFVVAAPVPFGVDLPAPGETGTDFAYTAVGSTAVVHLGDQIHIAPELGSEPIAPIQVGFDDVVLQQAGPGSSSVVVATPTGLSSIGLESGEVTLVVGPEAGTLGRPAAPVVAGGCVFSGWEQSSSVWRQCGERPATRLRADTDGETAGTNWIFRTNRDQVVLEGRGANPKHITDDGLIAIDNWIDFQSDNEEQDSDEVEQAPDQEEQAVCQDGDTAPIAESDRYGASPAVSIVLRVLDNDRDPNCDPIALRPLVDGAWNEAWGRIEIIEQGQAFQYTPPATPVGFNFEYSIDDGRGNEASAMVAVESGTGPNEPPRLKPGRASETIVELYKTVTYNVLYDWEDPDGDALLLESALIAEGDGEIIWSKNGIITYTGTDTVAGPKEVAVTVNDGFGNVTAGTMNVSVQGEGVPIPPTARDDYVQSPAGRDVVVEPLANDTDPNNDLLVLGAYEFDRDLLQISQGAGGTLRMRSDEPGTYLITYDATDGSLEDQATIRFEVTATDQDQRVPVAVRDSVVVKEGRGLSIAVLANDYDADGDVLILTGATLQQTDLAGIDLQTINRRYVRIEVTQDPQVPVVIDYTISDGFSPDQLGQLVVNVAPATGNQRPVPGNDRATVRVNDVVDIAVLANDADPDGDKISIIDVSLDSAGASTADTSGEAGQPGVLWLDGQTVRYRAGAEPGSVEATYTIDDSLDQSGLNAVSGFIDITVIAADAEQNLPPTPPPLETRAFAGTSVRIPIPRIGIDPDGDTVTVVELGDGPPPLSLPPQLGVPTIGRGEIVYAASDGASGQDVFSYTIEDAYGARAIGYVRVAVQAAPNHPPSLVPDTVRTRPGRILQVPVLANDSDPDGDALSLESVDPPEGIVAVVNETRVQVEVPLEPGTWQIYYDATDGKGPAITQVLTIVADEAAPPLPPIARDDPDREADDLEPVEQPDGSWAVSVNVLDNDDDPDGVRAELLVEIPAGQGDTATLTSTTGDVSVALGDLPQTIAYSITDFDGNIAHAVIAAPRAPLPPDPELEEEEPPNLPPELRDPQPDVTIVAGESGEIVIDDFFADPDEGDNVELSGKTPSSPGGEVVLRTENFEAFDFVPAAGNTSPTATIFIEVTDRPGETDAYVQLPVTIQVEQPNQPPETQAFSLDIPQLAAPESTNLASSGVVTDPEGDVLTFTMTGGSTGGVDVDISAAGVISASAPDAPKGAQTTVTYTVTDGEPDRVPVEGSVTVNVVASNEPLVSLPSITRTDITEGRAEIVSPLTGVRNPFPNQPLQIIDASLNVGEGAVSFTGTAVTLTPPDTFNGSIQVQYTVQDATEDSARNVTGTINYTVIGRPGQPGQPTVTDVSSHTAVVSWGPADANGTAITNYALSWNGGSFNAGTSTTATIDTLANNTPYTFRVVATNVVGDSDASSPSGEITPDEVPPRPPAPQIVDFGDGTLAITWTLVEPDGSPVNLHRLSLAGGGTETFPANVTSFTWEGLTNGTEYTFSLISENNEGPSEQSMQSNSLSPAREPEAPGKPSVTDVGNELQAQVLVAWNQPSNNGRDISGYTITDSAGGSYTSTETQVTIPVPAGSDRTFRIVANNVVGPSLASPNSDTFESIIAPAAPGNPTVTERDRRLDVASPTPGSDGGDPIVRYEYSLSGGGYTVLNGASPSGQLGGLTNGTAYSVAVRACNKKFCSTPSGTVTNRIPFGPPNGGAISLTKSGPSSGSQSFSVSWNGAPAANGRPITSASLSIPGVGSGSGVSGSKGFTGNWNSSYTATLTVTDSAGQTASRSINISIGAPPDNRSLSISWNGSAQGQPECTAAACKWISVSLSGFPPNSSTTIRCWRDSQAGYWYSQAVSINGSGNYSDTRLCYFGYSGENVRVRADANTYHGTRFSNTITN